jgi:hypothetical protein
MMSFGANNLIFCDFLNSRQEVICAITDDSVVNYMIIR